MKTSRVFVSPARVFVPLILLFFSLLAPVAMARVEFGLNDFQVSEFRDFDKLTELCAAPAAGSFFCGLLDATLTRIPTKGVDFFFDDAGELVAVFAKQQKGQQLNNYSLDNRQNLIPFDAAVPGGAVLLDGDFLPPADIEGNWQHLSNTEIEGRFRFRLGELLVDKRIVISNIRNSFDVVLSVTQAPASETAPASEAAPSGEPILVQYAYPGIARVSTPVIKIGQGETFSLNPLPQPVPDPAYISVQGNNRNTGFAIVMRPDPDVTLPPADLAAQFLPPNLIAMQTELAADPAAEAEMLLEVYAGNNELVSFDHEGYDELPGLFRPNVLGRLSLGIIWVLKTIHEFVPSWGLSIIVLTLLFRVIIWPLIATQTKSMYGMQQLQPKIQALQKKYKDDREKLTQETMKLYKEAGVNPAGGCLPILLQMPLFIILWRVFVNFEFNEGFLWIPDLGQSDPFFILPALYVGVMVAQSYFSARGNPQSLRQQLLINLVFVFIIVNFPAGVLLYFVVSMLIQVLQYWLLSRGRPVPAKAS